MNLPELYAKVCAKVPGAKVAERACGFRKPLNLLHMNERWWWTNEHGEGRCVYDEDAEAIILKHWLGMMPRGKCLVHMHEVDPSMEWSVFDDAADVYWFGQSPIEALAVYLLDGGTT